MANFNIAHSSLVDTTALGLGALYGLREENSGSNFYVSNLDINQYTLSTAWEAETGSSNGSYDPGGSARNCYFNADGSEMHIYYSGQISNYTCGTNYLASSASYVDNDTSANFNGTDIYMSPDGTELFVTDGSVNIVRLTLSTPFDPGSQSLTSTTDMTAEGAGLGAVSFTFSSDGLHLICCNTTSIFHYTLTTAWDMSTLVYDGLLTVVGYNGQGIVLSDDLSSFTIAGSDGSLRRYETVLPQTETSILTVDEVALFGSPLTAQDVTDLGGFTGEDTTPSTQAILDLNPSAYWKMTEDENSTVEDQIASYDGTWVGVSSSEAAQTDILGDGEPVLTSDSATTAYFDTTTSPVASPRTETWSFSCFIKTDDSNNQVCKYLDIYEGVDSKSRLTIFGNGKIGFSIDGASIETSTGLIEASTLYLVGVVVDQTAGAFYIYLNGGLVASAGIPAGGSTLSCDKVSYGIRSVVTNDNISTGHAAFYPQALTASDFSTIYGSSPNTSANDNQAIVSSQAAQTSVLEGTKLGSENVTAGTDEAGNPGLNSQQAPQSAEIAGTNTDPDTYIQSGQRPQGSVIATNYSSGILGDTLRFSTGGITTTPDSTPANTYIAPRLKNAGNFKVSLDVEEPGLVVPSFGQVTLDNTDGALDGMIERGIAGGDYNLYYGPKDGVFPDDFTKVASAVAGKAEYTEKEVKIQIKDKSDVLDQSVLRQTFSGTGGLEGDESLAGTPKPRAFGNNFGVPALLINSTDLIYYACQETLDPDVETGGNQTFDKRGDRFVPDDITVEGSQLYGDNTNPALLDNPRHRVFDGGIWVEPEADYQSEFELLNVPPSAGKVRWYRPLGGPTLFRLGSIPGADVRMDIRTSMNEQNYGEWFITYLLQEVLTPGEDYTLGRLFYYIHRFVNDPSVTYSDMIKEAVVGNADWFTSWFRKDGQLVDSIIYSPADNDNVAVSYEFTESQISGYKLTPHVPYWKVTVKTGETWPSNLNAFVTLERQKEFTETPYHNTYSFEKSSVRQKNKLATEKIFESKQWMAGVEAARFLGSTNDSRGAETNIMRDRQFVDITLKRGAATAEIMALNVMDVVTLTIPRFNWSQGKKFRIIGQRVDYGTGNITFTLWG